MNRTKIEWCTHVWNPVIGCTGKCPYCYARRMAERFHMTPDFSVPTWSERNFQRPFPREPSRIFVNSMSDVADWKGSWISRVMAKMNDRPDNLYLFLTKRPEDMRVFGASMILRGLSITNQDDLWKKECLRDRKYFLSIEPIHGPIDLSGLSPSWIIVGAETGNRKGKVRPDPAWLRDIYEYAVIENHIPLFFKESLQPYWPFDGYDYFPQEFPALPEEGERG